MTGVQDRVQEFLRSWSHVASPVKNFISNGETAVCCHCDAELTDGNFAMIDGKLYCLRCQVELQGR